MTPNKSFGETWPPQHKLNATTGSTFFRENLNSSVRHKNANTSAVSSYGGRGLAGSGSVKGFSSPHSAQPVKACQQLEYSPASDYFSMAEYYKEESDGSSSETVSQMSDRISSPSFKWSRRNKIFSSKMRSSTPRRGMKLSDCSGNGADISGFEQLSSDSSSLEYDVKSKTFTDSSSCWNYQLQQEMEKFLKEIGWKWNEHCTKQNLKIQEMENKMEEMAGLMTELTLSMRGSLQKAFEALKL